ncbi:MAG: hypothetical protein ACYC2Z_08125, partial [Candidatus Nanopelagicales bacterium]
MVARTPDRQPEAGAVRAPALASEHPGGRAIGRVTETEIEAWRRAPLHDQVTSYRSDGRPLANLRGAAT